MSASQGWRAGQRPNFQRPSRWPWVWRGAGVVAAIAAAFGLAFLVTHAGDGSRDDPDMAISLKFAFSSHYRSAWADDASCRRKGDGLTCEVSYFDTRRRQNGSVTITGVVIQEVDRFQYGNDIFRDYRRLRYRRTHDGPVVWDFPELDEPY